MKQEYFSAIKNPMTIIALFIGLTEIAFGIAFSKVPERMQDTFFWFMVIFPAIYTIGFFIVLILRPQNFYGPGDFKSEKNYLALNTRVKNVEEYAKLIDRKIEAMPLYRFPNLSECARRPFLSIYHPERGTGARNIDDIHTGLAKDFTTPEIENAKRELQKENWLDKDGWTPTLAGKKAHDILAQFVYGRLF